MKKHFISFIAGFGICFLMAMKSSTSSSYEPTKETANVSNYNGFLVYTDSKPVKKYEIVGFITSEEVHRNLPKGFSQQYTAIRDRFIQSAIQQYSGVGNGLIFTFCDGCTDKAIVIKIK